MPSSGTSWRILRRIRAAPLDKEEPRISIPRIPLNRGAATLYLPSLSLLSVSGLAQAVVQVSHPIPLNDLRVL
jgi:hypothetical protein